MLKVQERDPEDEGKISVEQLVDMYRIYEVNMYKITVAGEGGVRS